VGGSGEARGHAGDIRRGFDSTSAGPGRAWLSSTLAVPSRTPARLPLDVQVFPEDFRDASARRWRVPRGLPRGSDVGGSGEAHGHAGEFPEGPPWEIPATPVLDAGDVPEDLREASARRPGLPGDFPEGPPWEFPGVPVLDAAPVPSRTPATPVLDAGDSHDTLRETSPCPHTWEFRDARPRHRRYTDDFRELFRSTSGRILQPISRVSVTIPGSTPRIVRVYYRDTVGPRIVRILDDGG
jgi:hypothetical protein